MKWQKERGQHDKQSSKKNTTQKTED